MARGTLLAALLGVSVTLLGGGRPAMAGDMPAAARWEPWAEIAAYAANRSYAERGETALWTPLMQDGGSLLFADIRGKLFQDGEQEGNLALGYRVLGDNGWNPGIWFGVDRRYSLYGNDFDQLSFGAELLSKDWDVRANGYLPLEDTKPVAGGGTVQIVGNNIFLVSGGFEELALWGFDAEIGYRAPLERYGLDGRAVGPHGPLPGGRHHDLRLFLGGFYFDNSGFEGEVLGPRLRAEWRVENIIEEWRGSRLTLDASYQYDDVRKELVEAGLRLRMPLGDNPSDAQYALSPQEQRMTEGVKRDTDIVARAQPRSGGGTREAVEDAVTGVDFDSVVIVANGSDLDAAMNGAGSNALIVAQGGATNFNGVAMLANQTLLGGGGTIDVRGRTSGTVASYTAPGTRPTILGNCCAIAIIADDNAHIASVTLDGQNVGFAGVQAIAASTVIDNVEIRDFYVGLFDIASASHTVRNTTISNTGLAAIYLGGGNLDLQGSTLRNGGIGVLLDGNPGPATLAVNDTTFDGVFSGHLFEVGFVQHTVTASTGIVDNATSAGRCVRFGGGSFTGTLSFTDGDITDATCN